MIFRQLAGDAHAHRLYHWDGSEWDVLAAFPKALIASSASPQVIATELGKWGGEMPTQRGDPEHSDFGAPPFTTGWLGHIAYEYAAVLEASLYLVAPPDAVQFGYYEATLATHAPSGKTFCFGSDLSAVEGLLQKFLRALGSEIESSLTTDPQRINSEREIITLAGKHSDAVVAAKYQDDVEAIRQAILAGDLFQANLSREMQLRWTEAGPVEILGFAERLLQRAMPRYGAVLQYEHQTIASASPERFFRVESDLRGGGLRVTAEPIKGTRPRGATAEADAALAEELLISEKDRAENTMIVDLVRNDLSRICRDDSVKVESLCELRSFARVHHLVSEVSGTLLPGLTAWDALVAQFPCGSITGAPKWAAMDLIADLEKRVRGAYCGAIGFFDDRGHADFSVAIRTAVVDQDHDGATIRYGVGGGITVLSEPEAEFCETEDKAADFLAALQR